MKRVLLLLLLVGCAPSFDFAGVEKQVDQLSIKHGGPGWKLEAIDGQMNPLDTIEAHITDLKSLQAQLDGKPQKEASSLLIETRLSMLQSQQHFLESQVLDPRPLAEMVLHGEETLINASIDLFRCENKNKIITATLLLERSLSRAHDAINQLDLLLQQHEFARPIVGTDDDRPAFYSARLGKVWTTIRVNNVLVSKCQ
ncbi:hypothetical protein CMO91_03910 [Candidatus Woesearchaeota archaeon]|nr:hypothetical protein [Candidatus Woesearchaeota archaeon]